MVAAPQKGVFTFVGVSGKTYSVDLYLSDVANALGNFDGGAGAGSTSPDFWTPPEQVVLKDFAIHTGLTDTTCIRLVVNGRPLGQILRYITFLDTLANRSPLNIGFNANARFSCIQMA